MRLDVLSERTALRAGTAAPRLAARSGNRRSFYCGTDGSNPVPSGPFAERLRFTARLDDAQKTAGHRDPSSTNLYGSLSC
jgi:hypothetical protein